MKKTNNKGFSLVELIIVIAIMAILVGVLAPQYLKYVEKSKVSADKDLLDSIYSACTTASSDPDVVNVGVPTPSTPDVSSSIVTTNTWGSAVLDSLNNSSFADVTAKLKSKSCKGSPVTVSTDANGNFTVQCGSISIPEK